MFNPIKFVGRTRNPIFVHISLDVFNHFGMIISDIYFSTLCPFFSCKACNPDPCT
jgi:hypothetical protein